MQQSRVCVVEMSYLRGACGMTRWDGESNAGICNGCDKGVCAVVKKC